MFNPDSLKEIKILKENERQRIVLSENLEGKLFLKREISGDKREIYKALRKIEHPNIPKIYYVGLTDKTVIVEEYIEGESLNDLIEQNIKINKSKICSISKQVLSALEKLHSEKIIHRDVKPDNILIDKSNRVWLIDYDIARIHREEIRKDTESMGTFGYAPIEQYGMLPTDFKTDIYAFGVTLKTLLDYLKIKGFLYKIADKCKRLDPGQRYESAKEVKKAINRGITKTPLICVIAILAVITVLLAVWEINSDNPESYKVNEPQKVVAQTKDIEETKAQETEQKETKQEETEQKEQVDTDSKQPNEETETEDDSGQFSGFASGVKETEYREYPTFSHVTIFSIDEPWEHLLFLEDMNKKGKIKLGKNNTKVNADITLSDGELSVNLDDEKNHTLTHTFKLDNQYSYSKRYNENLRKNADIICRDLDYDDIPELLIGLNEGSIGVIEHQFYNNFNYCIAWCIKYDEDNGFTLCEGDMFSKDHSFTLNRYTNKLNVTWYDIGDITAYRLEGNKVVPVY